MLFKKKRKENNELSNGYDGIHTVCKVDRRGIFKKD